MTPKELVDLIHEAAEVAQLVVAIAEIQKTDLDEAARHATVMMPRADALMERIKEAKAQL